MKILLINPVTTEAPELLYAERGHDGVPMFASYLASAIRAVGGGVALVDGQLDKREIFYGRLGAMASQFDGFGINVNTAIIKDAIEVSQFLRTKSRAPIIWGGIHPSLFPEQTAADELVDFVVVGAGEYVIQDMIKARFPRDKKVWIDDGVRDISVFEPAYDIFDMPRYHRLTPGYRNITLFTSRGCNFHCSFCVNGLLPRKVNLYPLEMVERVVDLLVRLYGVEHVFIMDEHFYHDEERTRQIVRVISDRSLTWEANIRAQIVARMSMEQLQQLRAAGCVRIRMGCESASDRMLRIIKKGITVSDTITACVNCLRAGIEPSASFIINLPDERPDETQATIYLCFLLSRIGVEIIGPHHFRPYPGSEETTKLIERGQLAFPKTMREWVDAKVLYTQFMQYSQHDELREFFELAVGKFTTRQLIRAIRSKVGHLSLRRLAHIMKVLMDPKLRRSVE